MIRSLRLALFCAATLVGLTGSFAGVSRGAEGGQVVVIPIEGVVDEGMAHMVARAVDQANAEHAGAIVLEVNSPGGLVSAAFEIRDAIFRAKVPTVAYVGQRAFSAAALIALSAEKVVMAPGSSIGAAEPIPKTVKTVSALRAEFASTADRNHRDHTLAEAMVDANVDAPAYKKSGAILSLTADEAKRAKMADAISPTLDGALSATGVHGTLTRASYTWGEELARFATSPEVSGILLSIGVLGLFIELQTLHGIAGAVAIGALGLFFGTHVYAGFSNSLVLGLAVLGVIGILFEFHVLPGHGFAGILGTLALMAAVVLSFGVAFFFVAAQSIAIAIVLSVVALFLASRVFPESAFMRRIVLSATQGPEYVASRDFSSLVGRTGVAASFLRPAGVASVEGQRVDVLTEGDFVPAGAPIRVSRVEGARIFVQPLAEEK